MPFTAWLIAFKSVSFTQVYKARDVGVTSFVLFPKVPDALKVLY
jgi:hypothetical protein